jgi:hypothetical protein
LTIEHDLAINGNLFAPILTSLRGTRTTVIKNKGENYSNFCLLDEEVIIFEYLNAFLLVQMIYNSAGTLYKYNLYGTDDSNVSYTVLNSSGSTFGIYINSEQVHITAINLKTI